MNGRVCARHADIGVIETADTTVSVGRQAEGKGQGSTERQLSEVDVHIVVHLNLWKENGNVGISLVRISKKVEIVCGSMMQASYFYFRPAKVSIIFEISNTEKDFLRMGKAILPNHLTLRHVGHKTWEFVFAPFAALREEDRIVSCESCLGYLSQRG